MKRVERASEDNLSQWRRRQRESWAGERVEDQRGMKRRRYRRNYFRSLAAARPESLNGTDVEWSWRYLPGERVRSERMVWEEKGWESGMQRGERRGRLRAILRGPNTRGWLGGGRDAAGNRAESIKSNVWWRYNEMNLCRAVMPEYLATLFWFCSWPDRHPSRYTVFELNSTTGPPLQGLKRPQSG